MVNHSFFLQGIPEQDPTPWEGGAAAPDHARLRGIHLGAAVAADEEKGDPTIIGKSAIPDLLTNVNPGGVGVPSTAEVL